MPFQRTQVSIRRYEIKTCYTKNFQYKFKLPRHPGWDGSITPCRHHALMLRLYNLFQQSFSNCFSRNKLQMLTWARRLETRVVQSLHGCQFLEMGSIDKRRSVDNCPGHVTRDTWLWPRPAQHSGAAARVPQVPGPCRLSLQGRAGGILGQWSCKQWTVETQWQWQWLVLYNDNDNDHDTLLDPANCAYSLEGEVQVSSWQTRDWGDNAMDGLSDGNINNTRTRTRW